MRKRTIVVTALALIGLAAATQISAFAQSAPARVEYIDIRWDGTDRMCVVYPDGKVVFFWPEVKDIPRPDDANKRAFYLTIEMNRLTKEGYELAGFISDEILMKRTIR